MVFVFDENLPFRLAKALANLELEHERHGIPVAEVWHILDLAKELKVPKQDPNKSYTDMEVAEIAAKKGPNTIIISLDDDFKRFKIMGQVYRQHTIGVVWIKSSKHTRGYWNTVKFIIERWPDMKKKLSDQQCPLCLNVNSTGMTFQVF